MVLTQPTIAEVGEGGGEGGEWEEEGGGEGGVRQLILAYM